MFTRESNRRWTVYVKGEFKAYYRLETTARKAETVVSKNPFHAEILLGFPVDSPAASLAVERYAFDN